jgi:hypothetical protein
MRPMGRVLVTRSLHLMETQPVKAALAAGQHRLGLYCPTPGMFSGQLQRW